jgi:penicillin-binding protein 1A
MHHAFGGKTGTTNGFTDAWFLGFSPSVTCGTWIGFDNPAQSLGDKETGAKAALPIWMDFMRVAIADKPDEAFSKLNAPKKQIDIPVDSDDGAIPANKPDASEDDQTNTDDSAPAGTLVVPPPTDVLPEDTAPPEAAPLVHPSPNTKKSPLQKPHW